MKNPTGVNRRAAPRWSDALDGGKAATVVFGLLR
jgi:hypothetical protein